MNWNLDTEHYYVRFAHEEDITNIYTLLSTKGVVKHHPKSPMVVEAQAMDEARRMVMQFEAKEAAFWLVEEKTTGKVIARIRLQKFNWINASGQLVLDVFPASKTPAQIAEIVYAVLTLAYEDLSLHRVEWHLQASDVRSIELATIFGFQFEGQLNSVLEFENQWIDYQVYSMLNNDENWQQAIKNQGLEKG
jgi:ribosomal-protein-alanine N-acetyltransferase